MNQAFLAYKKGETTLQYGRQRILLDNQRFVGVVSFRKNEQTYDGFSISNKSIGNTKIFIANVDNVNRIFGESVAISDHENSSIIFNGKYTGWSFADIIAYAYLIDNEGVLAFSSGTIGIRFNGKRDRLSYSIEYATQRDVDNNPMNYNADYILAEGSLKIGLVNLALGHKKLGTDGTKGRFITPLATLHAFQGWTDVYLGGGSRNVPGGIEDFYQKGSTTLAGLNFLAVYHELKANDKSANGGIDNYDSEIGFRVKKYWGNYGLSFKITDYKADDLSVDTQKFWITASANF